ncbi:hypothetical protein RJ640_009781 [Escallonia rubra]|uniref:SKP1 component dimerisation domain-containing protein n=1 Tax=Escallonia rubra TaxID=112253 RepID=A0AA88S4V6_9ASTE|nr:hypothetical protein RJ640_009781 [Escallonia rubra]
MVIDSCKMHVETPEYVNSKAWDADLVKVGPITLQELIIKSLLDLAVDAVREMIKESPEEICKMFKIKNDFIPVQEEEVRRENPWVYE